jgi:hypothetical protein
MNGLEAQVRKEIERILEFVSELTGLPSHWSGNLELVPNADFKGKKRFNCDIQVNATLATQSVRWSTWIHEALHAVSVGYLRDDYQDFQGWEEGAVEQLQRLLRLRVLTRLGVDLDATIFQAIDAGHAYNDFIAALENLRRAVGIQDDPVEVEVFYLRLLSTPIQERPALVLGLGLRLQGELRRQFVAVFAAANRTLRTCRPQGILPL